MEQNTITIYSNFLHILSSFGEDDFDEGVWNEKFISLRLNGIMHPNIVLNLGTTTKLQLVFSDKHVNVHYFSLFSISATMKHQSIHTSLRDK